MNIFSSIAAGDSATWSDDTFRDTEGNNYTSAGFVLTYEIRGPGGALTLAGTPNGPGWTTAITTAQSAALAAARWWWNAFASASGVRVSPGNGYFDVTPNLALVGSNYDGRSQTEKDLDAVTAAIEARLAGGLVAEYSVAGRTLRREPVTSLIAMQSRLQTQVARERAAQQVANGLGNPRRAMVRFR